MSAAIRFERLARIDFQVREFHPVGESEAEIRACMDWVRSLGHEARTLEPDGFRYRSIYTDASEYPHSDWTWAGAGKWLMSIGTDSVRSVELDLPHDESPDEAGYIGYGESWHRVDTDSEAAS